MLILHKSFVCFIFEMVFRNGVLLLTDKIQVYFDRFHRVGMASCYILPHLPSMFYLGILSGSDIWNRHRALKCTCHHCYMAMMHTNFAFHNVCLKMNQIKQLSDFLSHNDNYIGIGNMPNNLPVYPCAHEHTYSWSDFKWHDPAFWHGPESHAFRSEISHNEAVNPIGHRHLNDGTAFV